MGTPHIDHAIPRGLAGYMRALSGGITSWNLARWASLLPSIDAFEPEMMQQNDRELRKRSLSLQYRAKSGEANSIKSEAIMDVNQRTVESFMTDHGVSRLIHGHTHRPNLHHFPLNEKEAQRYVLAEWHEDHAEFLSVTKEQWRFEQFN